MNLNLVDTTLTLAGKKTHFVSIKLFQKFYEHHRCEIVIDVEELDKSFMNDPIKIIKNIGESLIVEMKHKDTAETNVFKGIITNATMSGKHGQQGFVHIQAASDTIKLEGQPTMDSFVNKTLTEIAHEVVSTSGNGTEVTIKPKYDKVIEYLSQWEESGHQFFKRLSSLYGEAYYNDGTTTYFGLPSLPDAVSIKYDSELTSLNVGANLLPAQFGFYNYIVEDDQEWEKRTRKTIPEPTGYLKAAIDKSDAFYTSKAVRPLHPNVGDSGSILEMTDIERTKNVSEMLTLSGTSQTCKIGIGKVIEVVYPQHMNATSSAGNFLITEITHEVDQEGHYSNTFSGVRAALEQIPVPRIRIPVVSSQRAIVVSNADPYNWGRIQVRYQWQYPINKTTNWIRVNTPDGGSSHQVNSNRGFVFIPEVGDEVIINFENNDPSKPYCSGSAFSIKKGKGGGLDNHLKSIITRSGIKIVFNDEVGSLHIQDPSGNTWDMDGNGSIHVNAPKEIVLNANNITLNAFDNLNCNVGKNWLSNVGAKTRLNTTIFDQFITGQKSTFTYSNLIHSDTKLHIQSTNFSMIGKEKLLLHSDKEATINSQGVTNVHGKTKSSYTNSPLDVFLDDTPSITDVIVEFRPNDDYDGEFGFDWLRVDDKAKIGNEIVYYKSKLPVLRYVKENLGGANFSGEDAYTKIAADYEQITIKDETEPYFIPYLNIYPKGSKGSPKPPTKISLQILMRVKEKPEKIQIEFDSLKKNIKINGKSSPTTLVIGDSATKKKTGQVIEIECIKEFDTPQYICVYAYPPKKGEVEPGAVLAGKIKLMPNNDIKTQKILLVEVKTKTEKKTESLKISKSSFNHLNNVLYQAFIGCDVQKANLNLEKDINFKTGGKFISGGNLDATSLLKNETEYNNNNLFVYLIDKITNGGKKYQGYIYVFSFGLNLTGGGGMIQPVIKFDSPTSNRFDISGIGDAMILGAGRNEKTLAHETIHALGLWHTWGDELPGQDAQKKYIFYMKNDSLNIMSYNQNRTNTWKWQWGKMRQNVR